MEKLMQLCHKCADKATDAYEVQQSAKFQKATCALCGKKGMTVRCLVKSKGDRPGRDEVT